MPKQSKSTLTLDREENEKPVELELEPEEKAEPVEKDEV